MSFKALWIVATLAASSPAIAATEMKLAKEGGAADLSVDD